MADGSRMRFPSGRRLAIAAALIATTLAGCDVGGDDPGPGAASDPLAAKLADAFRIDVSELEVAYDYWPSRLRLAGTATLRFEMRPGQSRPLFHFNPLRGAPPAREQRLLRSIELDGEKLDPSAGRDLRRVRTDPSAEPAFEVERALEPGEEHTLRVGWSMPVPPGMPAGWLYTKFDDTVGPDDEIEALWPMISSPEELARHRFRVRVHAARPYTVLGSGAVSPAETGRGQAWDIDTGTPVASHTVFYAAVPADKVRIDRFEASGVPVRIVSDRPSPVVDRGRAIAQRTIARLIDDLGSFPVPRVDILLTGWGSGMEYYAATRTGIGSLEHELVHMYFGTTALNRTWRDIWIDEAAVVWWQKRDGLRPPKPGFRSDIAGGRSVVEPGFDTAAYGAGARIFEEIANSLGGSEEMIAFLADVYRRRAFDPFTTDELIDDVVAVEGAVDRVQLERRLFAGR